jgi:peptide chain release factor subunit 1
MIRHRDVDQLQQLSQAPGKTLTLYLDVDQTNSANRKRQYETRLKDMFRQLRAEHAEDEELAATADEVEDIVKRIDPTGKTLVLARHRGLGMTFRKGVKVGLQSGAFWGTGAYMRPLLEALDEHERFGVVLVDRKRARLFTVVMGDIEEHKDLIAELPPRPDSPSQDRLLSQSRMERHHDETVTGHLKNVAAEMGRILDQLEVDRLIIGGSVAAASELARILPKRLRGRLVEVMAIPLTATKEEILQRAQEVQASLERAEELEVVRDLLKEVRKGGRAVAGLGPTLAALNEGRVWKLVYLKDLKLEGGVCGACHMMYDPADEVCPLCQKPLDRETQMVDRMSRSVLDQGGHVEPVEGPAAEALKQVAEVAAILHA